MNKGTLRGTTNVHMATNMNGHGLGAAKSTSTFWGLVVGGAVVGLYVGGTVIHVLIENKLFGFTNRMGTKPMIKRAALVGGAFGAIPALIYGGVTYGAVRKM
jgi:hypothetical protein